jgi:PTH2 family peptidyl-tRNA hydrolase
MLKQVIVVRSDLKMGKGKLAAQVAHASLGAYRKASESAREEWNSSGEMKVVVKVSSLEELMLISSKAKNRSIPSALIRDAGKTQVEPGTVTSIGLGPTEESVLDSITGKLRLV